MVLNATDRRPLPAGWRWMQLGEICSQDRRIVDPGTTLAQNLPYLSLEHIESNTGRIHRHISGQIEDLGQSTSFAFDGRHILYGKLRPYLNKVALPEFSGRCTTELIPLLPKDVVDRSFLAWILRRSETVDAAMREKTGSRMPRADMNDLLGLMLPLPPLPVQRRIAAILNEQMAAVERARAACAAQVAAARALPAAYLREVFESEEAQRWPRKRMNVVCHLLPSKSIATTGDADVLTVTTACLTEFGFNPSGLKPARMWTRDVAACSLSAGEILVARSNTPELVGRVALYQGTPPGVVASDLTIRVWPGSDVRGEFLAGFLSFLYLGEYWKERAGGASGSMKKITRTQICDLPVPVPGMAEQLEIEGALSERIAAAAKTLRALQSQLDAINHLPAALLRRAFDGEL